MRTGPRRFALALATSLALATAWFLPAEPALASQDPPAEASLVESSGADPAGDSLTTAGEEAHPEPAARGGSRYSDQSAEGGAYQYRQILLALVIVGAMAAFLAWLVRRSR